MSVSAGADVIIRGLRGSGRSGEVVAVVQGGWGLLDNIDVGVIVIVIVFVLQVRTSLFGLTEAA